MPLHLNLKFRQLHRRWNRHRGTLRGKEVGNAGGKQDYEANLGNALREGGVIVRLNKYFSGNARMGQSVFSKLRAWARGRYSDMSACKESVGAMLCAAAITRFGSHWPLALFSAGGAASALRLMGLDPKENTGLPIFWAGVHALFVTTVQCIIYSLCDNVYPTNVRATGTAATLAIGRLGAILGAFAGAAVIAAGGAFGISHCLVQ
jgi:hypothetical protein